MPGETRAMAEGVVPPAGLMPETARPPPPVAAGAPAREPVGPAVRGAVYPSTGPLRAAPRQRTEGARQQPLITAAPHPGKLRLTVPTVAVAAVREEAGAPRKSVRRPIVRPEIKEARVKAPRPHLPPRRGIGRVGVARRVARPEADKAGTVGPASAGQDGAGPVTGRPSENPGVRRSKGQRRPVARGRPADRTGTVTTVPRPEIGRTAAGGTGGARGGLS